MAKKHDNEAEGDALPVDAPAPAPAAPPAAPAAPKLEPHQWAEKLGHVRKADPRIPQSVTHYSMEHACGAQLHGWDLHRHHYQTEPLLLTQVDYEQALEAGCEYPVIPAHEPALSPVKRPKEKR